MFVYRCAHVAVPNLPESLYVMILDFKSLASATIISPSSVYISRYNYI